MSASRIAENLKLSEKSESWLEEESYVQSSIQK